MKLSRRQFLALGASGMLFAKQLSAHDFDLQDSLFAAPGQNTDSSDNSNNIVHTHKPTIQDRVLPPALKIKDTIAITAPASHTSIWETRSCVRHFRNQGYRVEIGETIRKRQKKYTYLSASDEERAEEFMHYIERDDVKCILSGRGGYGVMRILHMLDFDVIKKNPKIIIGYSDITALLNAIYQECGIVTFHGPVAVSTYNSFSSNSLSKIIKQQKNFKPIIYSEDNSRTIFGGTAQGKLVGGNLTMVAATVGTKFQLDCTDKILFIEEVSEEPYKIDRMLTQMYLAGMFNKCRGVVVGYIKNLTRKHNFYPGNSYTVKQVLENRFRALQIPSFVGLSFGHLKNKLTIPIGIEAIIDADKRTLIITEPSVS